MKSNFTAMQRKTLEILLDKYENSKTYKGENHVQQSFAIVPTVLMPEYDSDFVGVDALRLFEAELEELASQGLVALERKGVELHRIVLNMSAISRLYEILNRKDKNMLIREQLDFYADYLDKNPLVDCFCRKQIELLRLGRKTKYSQEEAKALIDLCLLVLHNQQELLERELSIVQFSNSKLFEQKYRTRLCHVLQQYGNYGELLEGIDDKREIEQIILAEHNIYSNPSYLYVKGDAILHFTGVAPVELSLATPMAFASTSLARLERIEIRVPKVMTIENLTSFNRMQEQGYFYIFLSGYHNTAKQHLLMQIAKHNEELQWFHFGDIDPDGFLIIEHLRKKTGIDFKPIYMGCEELEKYAKYCKTLEDNDITKAKNMLQKGHYQKEIEYMLRYNCKLEQEIVSWMMSGTGKA